MACFLACFKCLPCVGEAEAVEDMSPTAEDPLKPCDILGTLDIKDIFGPYIRFGGYDPSNGQWRASILVISHSSRNPTAPMLCIEDDSIELEGQITAVKVDSHSGWDFWRFDLLAECGPTERVIEYKLRMPSDHHLTFHRKKKFVLPAINQKWHWGFYSCNGFHEKKAEEEAGGIQRLWKDVRDEHDEKPFHVMLGGGDQLYNDNVWKCPLLDAWTKISDQAARLSYPFMQEMRQQVEEYYWRSYVKHWCEDEFSDALAAIPQVMAWDDHDIFDGWGSYPVELQNCAVFQGVFECARKFYALFQHHTLPANAKQQNGYFGVDGWNILTCLGSTTAALVLDSRAERKMNQVVHPDSWAMIKERLLALPATVRQVVVVATVPVIYPKLPVMESVFKFMQGKERDPWSITQFMQKSGLAYSLLSQFGTIEILDDLLDHWTADEHVEEKNMLVHMMQELALARGFRFSLISGDVHVGAVGFFKSAEDLPEESDHRYIPQITSSAIGNLPPPVPVRLALTSASKPLKLDDDTREEMLSNFFGKDMLLGQRNWLQVNETKDSKLEFQFRAELTDETLAKSIIGKVRVDTWSLTLPALDVPGGPKSPAPGPAPPAPQLTPVKPNLPLQHPAAPAQVQPAVPPAGGIAAA